MAMSKRTFLIGCAMALMVAVALVDAEPFFQNTRFGKRADARIAPIVSRSIAEKFYGGPRFGRSGMGMEDPGRFFAGSRYGKRSSGETEDGVSAEETGVNPDKTTLVCSPLGIDQIYHCERKNNIIKTQEEP